MGFFRLSITSWILGPFSRKQNIGPETHEKSYDKNYLIFDEIPWLSSYFSGLFEILWQFQVFQVNVHHDHAEYTQSKKWLLVLKTVLYFNWRVVLFLKTCQTDLSQSSWVYKCDWRYFYKCIDQYECKMNYHKYT